MTLTQPIAPSTPLCSLPPEPAALDIIPAPQRLEVRRVLSTDTPDDVAAKVLLLERLAEWIRQVREEFEQSLTEYIQERGPVQVGDLLYWVGTVKKPPKCVDVPAAVDALLQAMGGDLRAFCEHLASGALKHGACSKTLEAKLYAKLFPPNQAEELQSDDAEKAVKKLRKADPQFMPLRAGGGR